MRAKLREIGLSAAMSALFSLTLLAPILVHLSPNYVDIRGFALTKRQKRLALKIADWLASPPDAALPDEVAALTSRHGLVLLMLIGAVVSLWALR